MAIPVKLDELLHARRMTLTELATRVDSTQANLSILKTGSSIRGVHIALSATRTNSGFGGSGSPRVGECRDDQASDHRPARACTRVENKQFDAQANLIKRREASAATRSLLNTARLMDENPTLLRLKELETLEKVTEKVGKLTVFGGLNGVLKDVVRSQVPT